MSYANHLYSTFTERKRERKGNKFHTFICERWLAHAQRSVFYSEHKRMGSWLALVFSDMYAVINKRYTIHCFRDENKKNQNASKKQKQSDLFIKHKSVFDLIILKNVKCYCLHKTVFLTQTLSFSLSLSLSFPLSLAFPLSFFLSLSLTSLVSR